jgi:sterol desaturase/sphingolipid hydroxylase (fatty acid hydroxylase superfamily)
MVPPLIFLPAIAITFVLGADRVGSANACLGVLAGYVVWTLFEYWLHRLVFHFEPEQGIGAKLHWMIHGVHHDHPNDPMRLVMPPSVSVPLSLGFYGLFVLAAGTDWGLAIFSGFLAGYLAYDMLHYHTHHHVPRTRLGRKLRELHMRHHFQDHHTGYGVSAPYWDHVFGTAPRLPRRTK